MFMRLVGCFLFLRFVEVIDPMPSWCSHQTPCFLWGASSHMSPVEQNTYNVVWPQYIYVFQLCLTNMSHRKNNKIPSDKTKAEQREQTLTYILNKCGTARKIMTYCVKMVHNFKKYRIARTKACQSRKKCTFPSP